MSVFKSFIFVLCFGLILGSPSWGMEEDIISFSPAKRQVKGPDDFKEEAENMFPDTFKDYSYLEFIKNFNSMLHSDIQPIFVSYFMIIFSPSFPKPKHSNVTIVNGYRCLYRKMAYANTLSIDTEKKDYQLTALYQLMAFHKNAIAGLSKELGNQIPSFPCDNCLKTANTEYAIPMK